MIVALKRNHRFSPPANLAEGQRVDSLAGHITGEAALSLPGH